MEDNFEHTIHDEREMNKIGLETFPLDKDISFGYSIDKLIEELKRENQKSWKEHDGWVDLEKNNPERYKELKEQAERHDVHIDHQRYEYIESIIFNDDQLTILSEMKIIYAYKMLEINIKKLLRAAFSVDTSPFYRWSALMDFLREKNIQASFLKGYQEVVQLQTVNNSLKHSDEISDKVFKIQEFKAIERLTYIELDKFYERVKQFLNIFLSALTNAVYTELYEFNDEKLNQFAKSFVLRMDKETAFKFTEKIRQSY